MKPIIKVINYKHKLYKNYTDVYEKNKTEDSPSYKVFMIRFHRLKSISKALKYTDKFSKGRRYSKLYLDYKNVNEKHWVSEPEFKRRIRNGLKPKFAILNKIRLRRLREQNIL